MNKPLLPRVNRTRALLMRGATQYDSGATRRAAMGEGLTPARPGGPIQGGPQQTQPAPGVGASRLGLGPGAGGAFPGHGPPGMGSPGQAPGGAPFSGGFSYHLPMHPLPPSAPIRTSAEGQPPVNVQAGGAVHSSYDAPEAWRSAGAGAGEMQGALGPLPQLSPGGDQTYVQQAVLQQPQQQGGSLLDLRQRLTQAQQIAQRFAPQSAQQQEQAGVPTGGGAGSSTSQASPDQIGAAAGQSVSASTAAPGYGQTASAETAGGQPAGTQAGSAAAGTAVSNQQSDATKISQAGWSVDSNGNVWSDSNQGVDGGTNYGNVNDPNTWGPELIKVLGTGQRGDSSSMSPEQVAQQRALEDAGFWIDPKTGNVYQPDADGHVDASEFNVFGNVYDGTYTGKAKGVVDHLGQPDKSHAWDAVLEEILGLARNPPQMDQSYVDNLTRANDQKSAYAAAQAIRAGLAASSRSRMGGGFQAGLIGNISAQEGVQQQQQDAQIRFNAAVQNLQLRSQSITQQLQALQSKMGILAGADQQQAAAQIERQLLQEKALIDRQLMEYQAQLALPGQILSGVLGAGGSLAGGWAAGGFK